MEDNLGDAGAQTFGACRHLGSHVGCVRGLGFGCGDAIVAERAGETAHVFFTESDVEADLRRELYGCDLLEEGEGACPISGGFQSEALLELSAGDGYRIGGGRCGEETARPAAPR